MKKSGTVIRRDQSDSPAARHLPLVDILVDAQAEFQALVVASGLKVLEAMPEEDRVAVCGPRYTHQPHRRASRAGHAPSEVVLGGRKVAIRRPRVRRDGREVALPSVAAFTDTDPLNRRVVEQMLIGVATRQYDRSLEPLGADVRTRGTSKSAVSRRFVAQTQAQLDAWRATPLDDLDLVALLIDGVQVGGHCIVVALGIDQTGRKHALGLWEGSTENTTVCQGLLTNLHSRGLRTDRSLLVILDGAKALHTAVTQTFGPAALVQRCQVHKRRNVLECLPEAQRVWVKAILTRAYTRPDVKAARRLLHDLARRLDADYPSAAASVREGLDESAAASRSAVPVAWVAQTLATSPCRLSNSTWPRYASFASFPWPFRCSIASGSVVDWCVSLRRRSPWKSTVGFPGSSGGALGAASRHRKLFRLAQASNCVPSTVKCSSESRPAARAWAWTASKKAAAPSPASSRSRFLVNVVGCQTGSSIFKPTNQRNSRLSLSSSISSRSLRIVYSTCSNRARNNCSGGIDGRPVLAYRPANLRDIVFSA